MRLSYLPALTVALAVGGVVSQSVADTFSTVSINSASSVYVDPTPDSLTDYTGAAVQISSSGVANYAFSNGAGYTIKPVTDDVFARASLADAELKTRAVLGFGANLSGGPVPVGVNNGSASATATFGDSFSTYAGDSPFIWANDDKATFQFAITGSYDVPAGLPAPISYDPGQVKNLILGSLRFQAYRPGGLALRDQLQNFDFSTGTYEDFLALNNQLEALRIEGGNGFWYLGDPIAPFDAGDTPILNIDPSNPTGVSFEFNPEGDFEWFIELDNLVQIDASHENVLVSLDFSHTVETTYVSPPGTTTYSSSGVFPNTIAIPEPATLALLPLAATVLRRRRD